MKTHTLRVALAAVFLTMLTSASHAAIKFYNITLNGANEAPPNASLGTGTGLVTVDTTLFLMTVQTTFSGLTGTTTAAHIHATTAAAFAGTAGVATETPTFAGFPLGVTSGTYTNTYNMLNPASYNAAFLTANAGSPTTAFGTLVSAMDANKAYLNIHTTAFGGGEIRGFTIAAPEPGTMALFAIGGVGVFLRRRKAVTA
jgi:CHRD domain/PEP-CTERM motif